MVIENPGYRALPLCSAPFPAIQTFFSMTDAPDTPDTIQEPRCWSDGRWTAQVIKNAEEIKLMRASSRQAVFGMTRAINAIKPGVRECEILAEAMHSFYSNGMEAPQCSLIVTSGDGTAPLRRFDAATLAYLKALPPETRVVLWWH